MAANTLPLSLIAALLLGTSSQSADEVNHLVAQHPRCFQKGFQFTPDIPGTNAKASSLGSCQRLCVDLPACAHFAYFPYSQDCYFGNSMARMVESPYGAIAGSRVCTGPTDTPPENCRTELPNDGFPGRYPNISHMAWPSGRQPYSLECWPKNWTGGYTACQAVTVLQDTRSHWPGKCMGLAKQGALSYDATNPASKDLCEADCQQNPLCATWQLSGQGECWQGVGRQCFIREGFTPHVAQRLQHGQVRKLMDLSGWQIVGLFKSFDNREGFFLQEADAVGACQAVCYSDLRCQFWQYSPKYGCFVEDPMQGASPAYPLTLDWAYRDTRFALDCIAGEFIQHYCPDHLTTAYPTESPEALASCMRRGVRFEPPDMVFQSRSVEANAAACQSRCRSTLGCKNFAFWPDGGCHLQDDSAKQVVAEDYRVISGPPTCEGEVVSTSKPLNATGYAESNWLTAEGEEVLNANVPGPNIPPELIEPTPAPAPPRTTPSPAGGLFPGEGIGTGIRVGKIEVTVRNLEMSSVNMFERQQLQIQYLDALSKSLGLTVNQLQGEPQGQNGLVHVHAEPPAGSQVVAYSEAITTSDVTRMQQSLESPDFVNRMKTATLTILGSSHSAIHGSLEVTDQRVHFITVQVTTTSVGSGFECNFLCMYWPVIVGCVLLMCLAGLLVGFLLFRKPPKRGKKSRGLLSDTDMSSSEFDSRLSDGDEDGDASIWASEPAWDSPGRSRSSGSPGRTRSTSEMYPPRGERTIFSA